MIQYTWTTSKIEMVGSPLNRGRAVYSLHDYCCLASAFVLNVLYIPGIIGAGTSGRWAFAGVILPILLSFGSAASRRQRGEGFGWAPHRAGYRHESAAIPVVPWMGEYQSSKTDKTDDGRERPPTFTSAHALGLLFIWYAALTIGWSHKLDGLDALIKLIVIAEAFWLGSKLDDLRPIIIGFGLGIWVNSAVYLFGIDVSHASLGPAGLFVNSNAMGWIAGLVLVAVCAHRLWWLVPGILPAFIMAQCRGAFVAVAGAFVVWVWSKSKLTAIGISASVLAGVGALAGGTSVIDRMEMLSAVVHHLSWMGSGLGSFYTLYPLLHPGTEVMNIRPEHLHNDWLEIAFETGSIGFACAMLFVGITRSITLAALFITACFGFPLHMAATAVLGGIVAGHAVRHRRSVWGDIAAWRISLRAWSNKARRIGSRTSETVVSA